MRAIGRIMAGSGFGDVIIEAGICASGIDKQSKHYNRAMRVRQHMLDAVERMVLEKFIDSLSDGWEELSKKNMLEKLPAISQLATDPSHSGIHGVEDSAQCKDFIHQFQLYKDKVHNDHIGKTAHFWMSYVDCVWIPL